MKIVVDTNILISAALNGGKPKAVINYIVANDEYKWIVSAVILDKYKAVLARPKFKLSRYLQRQWFELIDSATITIEVDLTVNFPRDRKDAKFLACAVTANANYLITGDRDFSEAQQSVATKIITAREFCELFE